MEPSVVWVDPNIPQDGYMFTKHQEGHGPQFSHRELTTLFFGRSQEWLRRLYREGVFDEPDRNGEEFGQRWSNIRNGGRQRAYSLYDIERMAHRLAEVRKIDGRGLHHMLAVCRYLSYIHDIPGV